MFGRLTITSLNVLSIILAALFGFVSFFESVSSGASYRGYSLIDLTILSIPVTLVGIVLSQIKCSLKWAVITTLVPLTALGVIMLLR